MAGRPPDALAKQFVQDTLTLTTHELAGKYGIAESTVRDWRLFCKRCLDLEVGYGRPQMHFLDKKEDPGPMDDEDVWALMARMSTQRDLERKAQDHRHRVGGDVADPGGGGHPDCGRHAPVHRAHVL